MDNAGPYLCCGMFMIPLVMGIALGAWWQKRLDLMNGNWKKAIIPDEIRQKWEQL